MRTDRFVPFRIERGRSGIHQLRTLAPNTGLCCEQNFEWIDRRRCRCVVVLPAIRVGSDTAPSRMVPRIRAHSGLRHTDCDDRSRPLDTPVACCPAEKPQGSAGPILHLCRRLSFPRIGPHAQGVTSPTHNLGRFQRRSQQLIASCAPPQRYLRNPVTPNPTRSDKSLPFPGPNRSRPAVRVKMLVALLSLSPA